MLFVTYSLDRDVIWQHLKIWQTISYDTEFHLILESLSMHPFAFHLCRDLVQARKRTPKRTSVRVVNPDPATFR